MNKKPALNFAMLASALALASPAPAGMPRATKKASRAPLHCPGCSTPIRAHGTHGYCPKCGRVFRSLGLSDLL
jgi:hypothetical protein